MHIPSTNMPIYGYQNGIHIMFYIYRYTCKINKKIYIGKTNNPSRRKIEHLSDSRTGISYFYNAIRNHGYENFEFEILEKSDNEEIIYKLETYYILYYKSNKRNLGYNLTSGGDGLRNLSEETIHKLSNIGKLRIGKKNTFYGKHHSIETKNKISNANRGKKYWLGKIHSEASKLKMSEANKGKRLSIRTEFKKGQIPKNAKINYEKAKEIRNKFLNGVLTKTLQQEYNLSRSSINKIINFKTFKKAG